MICPELDIWMVDDDFCKSCGIKETCASYKEYNELNAESSIPYINSDSQTGGNSEKCGMVEESPVLAEKV